MLQTIEFAHAHGRITVGDAIKCRTSCLLSDGLEISLSHAVRHHAAHPVFSQQLTGELRYERQNLPHPLGRHATLPCDCPTHAGTGHGLCQRQRRAVG